MPDEPAHLAQQWVHSHEEDSGGKMVFRPASFNFPLSRGRRALNLKKDGSLTVSGPGPTDRSQASSGTWQVAGNTLTLKEGSQPARSYQIASASPDKLVLTENA